jgi:hypothetical protein
MLLKPHLHVVKLLFKSYLAVDIETMFAHLPVIEVFDMVREVLLVLWIQFIVVLGEGTAVQNISFLTHSAFGLGHKDLCVIKFS